MAEKLYPLIFNPVFENGEGAAKSASWVMNFLKTCNLPMPEADKFDHCWLLLDSDSIQSTVANGPLAGRTLRELIEAYPRELVGREQSAANRFPVCIRFFATTEDQPLLVHAGEDTPPELNREHGNMKLWYSLAVQPDARAFIGINPSASTQQLLNQLHTPDGPQFMQKFKIRPGDSCLVPPGIIHSLSAGHLMWEIATRPVPPLRIGRWREEQPIPNEEKEKARQCLKQESRQSTRSARVRGTINHTRKIPLTRHWPYFFLEEIRIADHIYLDTSGEACHLLYLVSGNVGLQFGNGRELELPSGAVCCVPANLGQYKLLSADHAEVLRAAPPWSRGSSP